MPRKVLRRVLVGSVFALLIAIVAALSLHAPFPSDRTPEGAYLRIALSVTEERFNDAFPYLETEAQWACFTIHDLREKTLRRVRTSYPKEQQAELEAAYGPEAAARDGAGAFVVIAERRGWRNRLRRDLSGVASTQVLGERATVVTSRGTRYPFRRRDNGIWGLTLFTADLVAESERAARDLSVVTSAADDYDRVRDKGATR